MAGFLADGMLGKLARKLRMLGLDVADAGRCDDSEIRYRVRAEARTLLTRDRALAASLGERALLVRGEGTDEELSSISHGLRSAAAKAQPMSRCLEDNAALEALSTEDAAPSVPPHVLAKHDAFLRCPRCGRVYWAGTHVERMGGEVERLMTILEGRPGT